MPLFVDIDETILKAVNEEYFPRDGFDRRADEVITFSNGERFHLFLRPDLTLLLGRTFSLFTTGITEYASIVASILRFRGYWVSRFFSRESVCEMDEAGEFVTTKRPITSRASFLLDDLPTDSTGVRSKLCRLPGGMHIRTDAWTYEESRRGSPWRFKFAASSDSVPLKLALSIVDRSGLVEA